MGKVMWKGAALIAPLPAVIVSCGGGEKPNLLTVAWTGIINSQPPKTYISVRQSRFSYGIIKSGGEFVINLTSPDMAYAADLCGVKSGRDTDKFKAAGLTPQKSEYVSCPGILQSPLSIECKVFDVMPLGSHDMFLADILGVSVDEKLIDAGGRLNIGGKLMAYSHGEYFALGKKLGKFGFSVKKK